MIVPFILLGIALGFFIGAIATHADARRRAQIPADEFREKWKGIGYVLGYGAKEKEIADQLLEEQIRKDKENENSIEEDEYIYEADYDVRCTHCDCNVCCYCGYDINE
jgi:hypothetical protein